MTNLSANPSANRTGFSRFLPRWFRLWMAVPLVVLIVSGEGMCAWKARGAWRQWESPMCQVGAIPPLELGCDMGLLECCTDLGVSYRDGKSVKKDLPTAQAILEGTCQAPYGRACLELGQLHRWEGKAELAYEAFEAGCRARNVSACNYQAWALQDADGVARDSFRARAIFEAGCAADDEEACGHFSGMWDRGSGGPAENERAGKYATKACDPKSGVGCWRLRDWRQDGVSSRQDVTALITDLRGACERREAGQCMESLRWGESRPSALVQPNELNEALERACKEGTRYACNDLVVRRYRGVGAARDAQQAFTAWTQKCRRDRDDECLYLRALAKDTSLFDLQWPDTPVAMGVLARAAIELAGTAPERSEALARRLEKGSGWDNYVHLIRAFNHAAEAEWAVALRELSRVKDDPIVPVFRALIERRRQHSDEPWTTALITAWVSVGQPDLGKSIAFPETRQWLRINELADRSGPDPQQPLAIFVAALERDLSDAFRSAANWPEPPSDELIRHALELADSDRRGERILALLILAHPSIDSSLRDRARTRAKELLAVFAQEEPTNGYWPMVELFMEPIGWSLTTDQLQRLEAVTTHSTYDSHVPEVIQTLREGFREWGAADVENRAGTVWKQLDLTTAVASLEDRFTRSLSLAAPHERDRIMRVALGVGQLLSEAGSFSERERGARIQRGLQEVNDLPGATQQCTIPSLGHWAWRDRWGETSSLRLARWPLPQLKREVDDHLVSGQVAYLEELDALLIRLKASSSRVASVQ